MTSALVPVSEIERMAGAVAKSGLFGIKTSEQAMALMLVAQAEGLHPAIAARDYHIIQGRPALKADAMLARFQAAGGRVKWLQMSDTRVAGEFSHPQGGSVEIDWTIEMAKRAGLTKNPTWGQYPRAMLRARCVSEGIRSVFPGVVVGAYTPEEIADSDHTPAPIDLGPAQIVEPPPQIEDTLHLISVCETIDDLNLLRATIRKHAPAEREQAMQAAKRKADEIRAAAQTPEATDDPI
jgi:hypothetical protein